MFYNVSSNVMGVFALPKSRDFLLNIPDSFSMGMMGGISFFRAEIFQKILELVQTISKWPQTTSPLFIIKHLKNIITGIELRYLKSIMYMYTF